LAPAVTPHELEAALRIVLRTDASQIDRADWPKLIDIAARVVLAADDQALRSALFGESPGSSVVQPFVAETPPRRGRRRFGRVPAFMLAAGIALVAIGLNLLVGPSALLLKDIDAGLAGAAGQTTLLLGLGACAWGLSQIAVLGSNAGRGDQANIPPRIIAFGLPLATSLVAIALGLSVIAATRSAASTGPQVVVTALPRALAPAPPQPPAAMTQAEASSTTLLSSSAILIGDIASRAGGIAPTAALPEVATARLSIATTPSPASVTEHSVTPSPSSTFARVSDSTSGDALEPRPASTAVSPSVQIHLGPPPAPRPSATPTPRRALAAGTQVAPPVPAPPVFAPPRPAIPTVGH
jgi:hypothetical protein